MLRSPPSLMLFLFRYVSLIIILLEEEENQKKERLMLSNKCKEVETATITI